MKKILLITLLLIVGCSKEPINYETTLVERDSVYYTKDTNKPYSGPVFSLWENGQTYEEGTLKDGKFDGEWTFWNSDKIKQEITHKGKKKWDMGAPPGKVWSEEHGHYHDLVN